MSTYSASQTEPIWRKDGETVFSARGLKQRRLHKAFLRYHDPENWPVLRDALKAMGRADLIGPGAHQLVPTWQPPGTGKGAPVRTSSRKPGGTTPFMQQPAKGVRKPGAGERARRS